MIKKLFNSIIHRLDKNLVSLRTGTRSEDSIQVKTKENRRRKAQRNTWSTGISGLTHGWATWWYKGVGGKRVASSWPAGQRD